MRQFPGQCLYGELFNPIRSKQSLQYDRTATISIGGGLVDTSSIQDATVTLLDDDSTMYVAVYSGGNYYSGTQLVEGGQSGANTTTIRILRDVSVTQGRTVNYVVSGSATSGSDYTASPSLSGSVTIPQGSDHADFTITALPDSLKEGNETLTVRLTSGIYHVDPAWTNTTVTILDDYPTVTVLAATNQLNEGSNMSVFFSRDTYFTSGTNKSINFHISGTATSGTDFTFPASAVITGGPPGYVTLPLNVLNDSLVEGVENLTITLDSGVYDIGNPGSLSVNLLDDYPLVNVTTATGTAWEQGTIPGVITFKRAGNLSRSVTAQYQVTGTAVAGTHYQSLPGSVTFAIGQTVTNVPIIPINDGVFDNARSVVVTLQTNASYVAGVNNQAAVTIISALPDNDRIAQVDARYFRAEPHPAFVLDDYTWDGISSVIPLDGEVGVTYDDVNGSLATNFVNRAWTNVVYHFDWFNNYLGLSQTNITNRLACNNPIVAFGGGHGGSPLFIGQRYSVGVYAGDPAPAYTPIRIAVYNRTNGAYAGEILMPVPNPNDANNWTNYANGDFEKTVEGFGLKTTLRHTPQLTWGVVTDGSYVLTHEASETAKAYYYLVEATGYLGATPMVVTSGGSAAASRLYTMEFEPRPSWRANFVDQPHFERIPLPPAYDGKSPEELLMVKANLTNQLSSGALSYTNLNQSPELRRHPLLDQLVNDLRRDPIAIANYVQNEIELTDPIGLNDDGPQSEQAVNLGGVNRSALGVYLEGQGSPIEQCELLIYMLRAANVPAAYVFAPSQGVKMLDDRLSRLLKMRLPFGRDAFDKVYTANSLIGVNYPWVAAYVNGRWVHLFPWLKDYEVIEGMDLRDVLSSSYPDAFSWVRDYIMGNTNLMAFASPTDQTFGYIYPRWLESSIQQTAPGLSAEDVGMRWRNRPQYRSRWEDFPQPTQVTNTFTAIENLTSTGITNISPALTNIFNTVAVEVYSKANPLKRITTPPLRMADLNDRKFYITHVQSGGGHQLQLNLGAFGLNTNSVGNFSDADLLQRQQLTLTLDSTDDELAIRLIVREHRAVTPETPVPANYAFLDLVETRVFAQERPINKGDLVGICFAPGRVTKRMLDVHARELWQHESVLNSGGTPNADIYNGTLVYLMGQSYFERSSRVNQWINDITKMQNLSTLGMGLAKFSATRDGNGKVTGQPDFTRPALDMFFYDATSVGNYTVRLDSGHTRDEVGRDNSVLLVTALSSEEHQTLNVFLRETNAVSTVRLMQLAQARATNGNRGVIFLNLLNADAEGAVSYQGKPLNQYDVWPAVVDLFTEPNDRGRTVGFITPGPITNSSGSFRGLAFLGLGWGHTTALIGQNLNGAYGDYIDAGALGAANAGNIQVRQDANGDYYTLWDLLSAAAKTLAPDATLSFDRNNIASGADNDYYLTTDTQNLHSQSALNLGLISTSGGSSPGDLYSSLVQADYNRGDAGNVDFYDKQSGTVADPVSPLTGEFYHEDVDLTLPGPFPLQLRRNYSSQNLADNQFGQGWKINYLPFLSTSVDSNIIYAAEMDGSTLAYERQGTNNLWKVTSNRNPMLDNNSEQGIGSIANRLRQYLVRTNSTYTLYGSDGSLRTYQLSPFGGAPADRPFLTRWQDNRGNLLTFEYNTDTSQPDFGELRRIQAANGNSLGFYFDAAGHIVEAYTGDGRRVKYDYDQFGDLARVTRPDNSEVSFEYEHRFQNVTNGAVVKTLPYSTHLLTREVKPDGRVLINQYDNQRRVTNQLATVGVDLQPVRNATFIYSNNFNLTNSPTNTITGFTLIKDVFNSTNRYDYTNGLITKITDAMGLFVIQDWFEPSETNKAGYYPRSLEARTDKRGLLTAFKYDANGNATNTVITGDLLGDGTTQNATNTIAYDANNLPTSSTDPIGNKVQTLYHAQYPFLPEYIVRFGGSTPISTNRMFYGNVTNTFVMGGVNYTNIAAGVLLREIRAFGSPDAATNDWTYDGRGFITQSVRYTGTSDPAVTNTFFYNGRAELVEQADAAGRKTTFSYDGMGRPEYREVYEANQSIPLAWEYSYYNDNGELTWSDGPRFNPEDYTWRDYDGGGRLITQIRWRSQAKSDGTGVEAVGGDDLYAQSFFEYDTFGNLKRAVDPRGAITTNSWDSLGRLIQRKSIDLDGTTVLSSEGFAYEPGGLVRFQTNALGGVTETQYTTNGLPKFRRNPDGSTNAWRYYVDGRTRRETQSNGAYSETTYDDANRTTTRIFYSAAGAPLATNISVLDRRGNVVQTVDAGGNVFTSVYDGLDRLKVIAGPPIITVTGGGPGPFSDLVTNVLQHVVTNLYDSAGIAVTNVNVLAEKTISFMDALGRITRVEVRNAAGILVRETSTAYAADHQSVTVTNGSGAAAIVSTTYTDNDGHTVLSIAYPGASTREFTFREYDAAGNLAYEERDSSTSGVVTGWSGAAYMYDGVNRLTAKTDRDSAVTQFRYDAGGNLTNRTMPGGLQWQARYDSARRILEEKNVGSGGVATRTNTYTYYGSGPFTGLLQTRADGRGVVCTYTYDDYLRQATNTHSGPLPEHNLTTVRQYEPRGFVTGVTEQFASGSTGPSVSLARSYDAYGQMSGESVAIGGATVSFAGQAWDAAGRRTSLGLGNGYTFGWQADGQLSYASLGLGAGTYSYTTGGLLTNRTVGNRQTTISSRDGAGRPLTVTTKVNTLTKLTETLSWTGDGMLNTHSLAREDFTDSRSYFYANLSRRLTEERLNLDASKRWTNVFAFDNGTASGPGVLTKVGPAVNQTTWAGVTDPFSRVGTETNTSARQLAYGRVNGQSTVAATLDGVPQTVTQTGTGDSTWTSQWRTTMELTPGTHRLDVSATHPSGQFTTNQVSFFTNNIGSLTVTNITDGAGNLTQRIWRKPNGTTNLIQTLAWDARGRLYKVTERDGTQSGRDFFVTYDALGRRLQTKEITVTNSVALTNQPLVVTHYFDPLVEFLELGVTEGSKTSWKLIGPDFDGDYGGQNGTGGFEGVASGFTFSPIVADALGNVHAVYVQSALAWNSNRVAAYGGVPGYRPVAIGGGSASLAIKYAWRNRAADTIGLVWMGGNWLDPQSGQFISFDPLGHDASDNGYTFCMGNPVGFRWDADGRAVIQAWQQAQQNLINRGGFWNNAGAYGISFGITALNAFSVGSFAKNDRLADRNIAGEISDAQFYGGMTVNAAVAGATIYTGGTVGTFTAGRLIAAGATPLTGLTVSGAAAGFTSGVTDVAGTRLGYAATGLEYEHTVGQDLTSIGISTGMGAGFGALTYAGMRGEGIIYNRTDANGLVDPYYGQARSPGRYTARQGEHDAATVFRLPGQSGDF